MQNGSGFLCPALWSYRPGYIRCRGIHRFPNQAASNIARGRPSALPSIEPPLAASLFHSLQRHTMITTIAQALFDRLIDAFPPDRTYGHTDIRRDPMPGALADYLEQVLHMKLRDALPESNLQNSWVDLQAAEAQEAHTHFMEVLKRHQAFPAFVWADFLKNACQQTLYLVIQPTASLIDSVFDPLGNPVRVDTIRDRMGLYPAKIPYREVLEAWLEEQGDEPVGRDRFEAFLYRADRQLASDSSPQDWLRLFDPLVKVLATAGYREAPTEFVEAFLHEKGAETTWRRLEQQYGSETSISFDELEVFFVSGVSKSGESARKAASAPTRPAERRQEPQPLWKQFAQGRDDISPTAESSAPSSPAERTNHPAEPLWKQFRTISPPVTGEKAPEEAVATEQVPEGTGAPVEVETVTQPEPSVRIFTLERSHFVPSEDESVAPDVPMDTSEAPTGLIGLEHTVLGKRGARNRDLFVQCLFHGKEQAYEAVLQRLEGARDWSEASQTIANEVFLKHQVNIYSPPAVTFTEAVEARYRT